MSTVTEAAPIPARAVAPGPTPGFGSVVKAEWVKMSSVRSTWWTLALTFVLGAGLTVAITAANAEWLASADANESPGSFITWGMVVAQICAVVFGALLVTTEYSTGMAHTSYAAVPARGKVLAAKALLGAVVIGVLGAATAFAGYFGANYFLDQEGIGMALEGDVLRAMYGSGLYLAGIALMTVGLGFILRHTAGTISLALALILILPNMVMMVPGEFGEWLTKLMPGNAGQVIATAVPFNPDLLDPWPGFGVFMAQAAVVLALAWVLLRRRDA